MKNKKVAMKESHTSIPRRKRSRSLKRGEVKPIVNSSFNSREKDIFHASFLPKNLQHLSEKSIEDEITHYFEDMTICRKLKKYGPSFLHNESLERELFCSSPVYCRKNQSRTKKLVEELCDMMESNAYRSNGSASKAALLESLPPSLRDSVFSKTYPFSVRCSDVQTVIIDAEPCRAISNQLTVLAETTLKVHVKPVFSSVSTSKDQEGDYRAETRTLTASQNSFFERKPFSSVGNQYKWKVTKNKDIDYSSSLREVTAGGATSRAFGRIKKVDLTHDRNDEECFSLSFYSTHFLDASCVKSLSSSPFPGKKTQTKRKTTTASSLSSDASSLHSSAEPWCAIQSLVSLQNAAHLEYYTYHMLHFGLLCYSVWNVSSSWLKHILLEKEPFPAEGRTTSELATPEESFTHWPQNISHFFPFSSKDRILILGLGGNVLGSCLDICLSKAVQLDVVEIEPAMFDICYRNGLIPSLSSPVPLLPQTRSTSPCESHFSSNDGRSENLERFSSFPCTLNAPGESVAAGAISLPKTASKQKNRAVPWVRYDAVECFTPQSASFAHFENIQKYPTSLQQRGAYRFYLMDANDFLQHRFLDPVAVKCDTEKSFVHPISSLLTQNKIIDEMLCHHPTAQTVRHIEKKRKNVDMDKIEHPTRSTFSPVGVCLQAAHRYSDIEVDELKYNLIFLDCYDPHQGTMVHNSSLLTRCRNRLSPGGALLINAHVDTDANTLTKCFLTQGFASVQVLKVSGCRQCIVVCLLDGEDPKEKKNGDTFSNSVETEKRTDRIVCPSISSVRDAEEGLQRPANRNGRCSATAPDAEVSHAERFQLRVLRRWATYLNHSPVVRHSSHPLVFDPEWLTKSSVVSSISAAKSDSLKSERYGISLCRVWEHRP